MHASAWHRSRSPAAVFPRRRARRRSRSAAARRAGVALRRDVDYFTGLDHLVNDRFDRATEVFTRLATKSHEADIQFALGSLMRKRGEVDRAIAIHTELAAQPRGRRSASRPRFALGLDYMSAGLMDRAEEKLRSLHGVGDVPPGGAREAGVGVRAAARMARRRSTCGASCRPKKQRERAVVAAHYCCELGEAALAARRSRRRPRAGRGGACARSRDSARASILAARIAAAAGDERQGARRCTSAALSGSRTMQVAFDARSAQGAENAMPARSIEYLRAHPPQDEPVPPSRRVSAARSAASRTSPGTGAARAAAAGTRCAARNNRGL